MVMIIIFTIFSYIHLRKMNNSFLNADIFLMYAGGLNDIYMFLIELAEQPDETLVTTPT